MGIHTIEYNGRRYDVNAATHVDDHASDNDWIKKNQHLIATAIGVSGIALQLTSIIITHKPMRG